MKGAAAEREVARIIGEVAKRYAPESALARAVVTDQGVRRGIFAAREPDVVCGLPGVHLEVKRTEVRWEQRWWTQAVADAGDREPVVVHRMSRQPWRIRCCLSHVANLEAALRHGGTPDRGRTVLGLMRVEAEFAQYLALMFAAHAGARA